jgi:hypothetical protein
VVRAIVPVAMPVELLLCRGGNGRSSLRLLGHRAVGLTARLALGMAITRSVIQRFALLKLVI